MRVCSHAARKDTVTKHPLPTQLSRQETIAAIGTDHHTPVQCSCHAPFPAWTHHPILTSPRRPPVTRPNPTKKRCGNNYGWREFEGSRCNDGLESHNCTALDRADYTFPAFEYCHFGYDSADEEHDACGDRVVTGLSVIGEAFVDDRQYGGGGGSGVCRCCVLCRGACGVAAVVIIFCVGAPPRAQADGIHPSSWSTSAYAYLSFIHPELMGGGNFTSRIS